MIKPTSLWVMAIALTLCGCATDAAPVSPVMQAPTSNIELADIADRYIRLTLEAGTHEPEWVDAYYGPPEQLKAAEAHARPVAALRVEARSLIDLLDAHQRHADVTLDNRRRAKALRGMLVAAETRLQMLEGRKFSFADEAKGQFATQPVLKPLTDFDPILARLDKVIPGKGSLASRVDTFNDRFTIPKGKLKTVFDAAIAECRKRTAAHIVLPEGESFAMEFVTGKTWSGYNYYKGVTKA